MAVTVDQLPERRQVARRWQFSLRQLVMWMLLIGLLVGYASEQLRRRAATLQLHEVLATPHVLMLAPESLTRYSTRADIATMGKAFLPADVDCQYVNLQILTAEDARPIAEMGVVPRRVAPGVYAFTGTFKQPLGLEPGAYVIRASCVSGASRMAIGETLIRTVDTRSVSPPPQEAKP